MTPDRGWPRALPLWPLALAAALLPAIAALLAVALYAQARGSLCNPFVDDCVSISRMARHGLANHLFRALVLPGAVLQLLTWLAASLALSRVGLARRDGLAIALLGACAGLALVVYASFLGSDGQTYRWLRRWGTLAYFGGTYLAMLMFVRAAQRLHLAGRLALPRGHERAMVALLAFIAMIGLGHVFASQVAPDSLVDRFENLTEWWSALALTLCFAVMASLWRRWALTATICLQRPGP
jgi:hypothetical protein